MAVAPPLLQLQSSHSGRPKAAAATRWSLRLKKIAAGVFYMMDGITSPTKKQVQYSSSTKRSTEADILISDVPTVTHSNSAPLVDALKTSAEQDVSCFHFPGHNRGKAAPPSMTRLTGLGPFLHDLPELSELDDLFSPKGVILDAQKQAAQLFGASETWFLVGGTTCGIQASIMSTCSPGDTLILPRNSHISAISGLVLSGAVPKYIMPEYKSEWDIAGGITPLQVDKAIKDSEAEGKRATAVLITSPTYHGICSNLTEITKICHSHGIPVIVDEAHGAHFGFHAGFPGTALEQGADLAVQSTHKVLCSFTQSSMLHMSGDLIDRDQVSRCLQTLQSSSPSYLLLASLDAARAQLSENPDTIFNQAMDLSIETRRKLRTIPGISVLESSCFVSTFPAMDPLRITVNVSQLGISGYRADEILCDEHHVIAELAGNRYVTFAINLGTCSEQIHRLVLGIRHLSEIFFKKSYFNSSLDDDSCAPFNGINMRLSPRAAFFAKKMKVRIEESLGKTCGELVCSYPPGIPVLIPGEDITEEALAYLLNVRRMGAAISGAADPQLSSIVMCDVPRNPKL